MIKISIDVTKINKERLFVGKNGKYLNAVLIENRAPDKYGNDGFISEDVSKEERAEGVKGTIIGNFKNLGKPATKPASKPAEKQQPKTIDEDGEAIPF